MTGFPAPSASPNVRPGFVEMIPSVLLSYARCDFETCDTPFPEIETISHSLMEPSSA
jgi:hypothetical protein